MQQVVGGGVDPHLGEKWNVATHWAFYSVPRGQEAFLVGRAGRGIPLALSLHQTFSGVLNGRTAYVDKWAGRAYPV